MIMNDEMCLSGFVSMEDRTGRGTRTLVRGGQDMYPNTFQPN